MTCLSDLDCGLQRVASRILSCRNQPAELDPSAMTRQLQEAQVGNAHREESSCVDAGIMIDMLANVSVQSVANVGEQVHISEPRFFEIAIHSASQSVSCSNM